jgi:predicted transcriptional regulator of viral defense system
VKVLIGEGKDSKRLSPGEETELLDFARKFQSEFHHAYITPKELRELAGMGHTSAEQVQSSKLLKNWTERGFVTKIKKGLYFFPQQKQAIEIQELRKMIQRILNQPSEDPS